MITITESASRKIAEILSEEKQSELTRVRVFVQGGGCSGMEYGFTFDDNKNDDDFEILTNEGSILVDGMSIQYLSGAEIDYIEDLNGSQFKIRNPNAQTTCGCGSSFSPY
jgi:iron-sulfur cluster insertion protein